MDIRRIKQVWKYGWQDAGDIVRTDAKGKSRLSVFCDILYCYFKFNVWSNQYKKEKLYSLTGDARKEICLKYQEKNTHRDRWVKEFFDNYKFLYKWSSFKYETSAALQAKRRAAYKKQYGLGDNCFIGYDVILHRHHYVDSNIVTGRDCLLAEHVNIDYTGGLTLGYKVGISEGAKIFTHNHVVDFSGVNEDKGCIKTPLIIHDRAWIGARVTVMPGVKEIGRGAVISADSCIRKKVPPYAIVMGNPAKIVGFRLTPKEILEREMELYPENERIPLEILSKNYERYYLNKKQEIKSFSS